MWFAAMDACISRAFPARTLTAFIRRYIDNDRSHTLYVPLFTPQATSALNGILSTVTGKLPEFLDARFVSKHDGREVIRVKSRGAVKLSLHVMTKDFERFGYTVSKPPVVGNKK
jgi:hypothetical protein